MSLAALGQPSIDPFATDPAGQVIAPTTPPPSQVAPPVAAPSSPPAAPKSAASTPVSTPASSPNPQKQQQRQGSIITVNTATGVIIDEMREVPKFEGHEIGLTTAKIASASVLLEDRVLSVDDVITLNVKVRCVGIGHDVDDKTGQLARVHKLKVLDVDFAKWDALDPSDDGTASP